MTKNLSNLGDNVNNDLPNYLLGVKSKVLETRQELDSKIPRDVISQRASGNGMSLSYLEGWYVIDRLNKVIGQGDWSYESFDIKKVFETSIENKSGKKGRAVAYTAQVKLTVHIENKYATFIDIGAGKGIDYNSGLEADESAVKEAVTDALKRCAKNLGMSMGLALYDKTQENVSDEPEPEVREKPAQMAAKPSNHEKDLVKPKAKQENSTIEETIRSYVRVAEKQKRLSVDQFKTYLKDTHSVSKLSDLDEDKLNAVLAYLQELTK